MKQVYLDNAAATPIYKEVTRVMEQASFWYANPSSYNHIGREARQKLESARTKVARFLGARPGEIIFTASGSEANNLAVRGVFARAPKKARLAVSAIEHPSLLQSAGLIKAEGYKVDIIPVDQDGFVSLADVESFFNPSTCLISIMYANNEIGTIEPISKIGALIRAFRTAHKSSFPLFHVDACQAPEYLDMNVNNLKADLLTFNGSKIYGPRGIGVLYAHRTVTLSPLIVGGGQEHGLRAGTENLPGILGLAVALERINQSDGIRIAKLRDYTIRGILRALPEVKLNGPKGSDRLANNINISIPRLESENLLLELDKYGIWAGSGSACTSRSVEPSHVLRAIGVRKPYLDGALRFSLGRQTTKKDIDYLIEVLPKVVRKLRKRFRRISF